MIGRLSARPATAVGLALAVLILVSIAVSVTIGSADLSLSTVIDALAARLHLHAPIDLLDDHIVWDLRMPRIVGAVVVGAGLAVGGAVVQALTRNGLADPYLLGISGGASVGAVAAIVLGVGIGNLTGTTAIAGGAFVGGMAALAAVLLIALGRGGTLQTGRIILAGIAVGQVGSAITAMIVLSGDGDAARRVLDWTLGSLGGARWPAVAVTLVVTVLALSVAWGCAGMLDAFAFGERAATSLGVSVAGLRWTLYVTVAAMTSVLVSLAGAIGFVGLVVPHLVRLVVGTRHLLLIPLSALAGGLFLLWADNLARAFWSQQELPLGVVTAVVGVPVLIGLMRRRAVPEL